MTHHVEIAGTSVSVRIAEISKGVFEAVGRFRDTDFFVKGTSVDEALERFRQAAERKATD